MIYLGGNRSLASKEQFPPDPLPRKPLYYSIISNLLCVAFTLGSIIRGKNISIFIDDIILSCHVSGERTVRRY